jgi:hypothetical protein
LSSAERQSLEAMFSQSEGRLKTFTFLDPTGNLLAYSGDFLAAAWTRDPLLQVTAGFSDPDGGTAAFRLVNNGSVEQQLRQPAAVTGAFRYTFTLYMRSQTGSPASLKMSTVSNSLVREITLGPAWTRAALSETLGVDESPVVFAIALPPGASADIYGAQCEPQPAPSVYRQTAAQSGVYENARFDQDDLEVVTDEAERHSLIVRITSGV